MGLRTAGPSALKKVDKHGTLTTTSLVNGPDEAWRKSI